MVPTPKSLNLFLQVEDLVTAPSAETELLWLFKHALAGWPSTRELREELAPYEGVGGIGLRYKLLSAAIYLQVEFAVIAFEFCRVLIQISFRFSSQVHRFLPKNFKVKLNVNCRMVLIR